MKIFTVIFISIFFHVLIRSQQPFILSIEQPAIEIISDVVQIDDYFYFLQNRLVNLTSGSDYDAYSDLLITTENGTIIAQMNLDGFRTHYERIIKVEGDFIYLTGYVKTDTCLTKLILSRVNIQTHIIDHISSYDFCNDKIETVEIKTGLLDQLFIEGRFSTTDRKKFIIRLDSAYQLKLIQENLSPAFTLSVDFSRKGYLISESRIFNYYDADFNFRKQAWFYEDPDYTHETHKSFGNHFILIHSVQDNHSLPSPGIQIMLVDSSLKVRKRAVFLPASNPYAFMNLTFYDGMDIKNKNEIWTSATYQLNYPFFDTSFYCVARLDSNLNILCQHFLGFDSKYRIFGIRALESGGAIVYGNKARAGHDLVEGQDIYAIRVGENCELPAIVATNGPPQPLISISVFPNPGINDLTFSINGFDPSTLRVELIDESGQVLFSIKNLTNSINVPELPAGQYFYRIMQKERLLGIGAWVKE